MNYANKTSLDTFRHTQSLQLDVFIFGDCLVFVVVVIVVAFVFTVCCYFY